LIKYGVTSFCPTVYPASKDKFFEGIACIKDAINYQKKELNGAKILGIHLEGPFISKEKKGVHKEDSILPIDIDFLKEAFKIAEGHISNITVAPELQDLDKLVLFAKKHDILLQMGHTNAAYDDVLKAVKYGIEHVTHFFNAMTPLHHRDPGVIGTILSLPFISMELICDCKHFHPIFFNMFKNIKDKDKLIMVTDSLSPTGQSNCPFYANGDEVELKDSLFIRKEDQTIAGSSLTMIKGLKNLIANNVPLDFAIPMTGFNIANLLNRKDLGRITLGAKADLNILDKDNFEIKNTLINGKLIN